MRIGIMNQLLEKWKHRNRPLSIQEAPTNY